MEIKIYDKEKLLLTIKKVITATLTEKLSGENSLYFTTTDTDKILPGMTAHFNGQLYSIVRVAKTKRTGLSVCNITCEHITNILNDEKYNLNSFVFSGTPTDGLTQLLEGTPFTVGTVEPEDNVSCRYEADNLNRRKALMSFVALCGGEIDYSGMSINIIKHKGSAVVKEILKSKNVTDLSCTLDSREKISSYSMSLYRKADISLGDEIHIKYTPLSIDVTTRIIEISYNPFYSYSVSIKVGAYVPTIMKSTTEKLNRLSSNVSMVSGRITGLSGSVSSLSDTVNAVSDKADRTEEAMQGINSALRDNTGNISNIQQKANEISSKVEDNRKNISTLTQTSKEISTRVEDIDGNVSTLSQTANKINWLVKSGTSESNFTMTDRAISLIAEKITITGAVTFDDLKTKGKTEINGGNIITDTLTLSQLKTNYSGSDKIAIDAQINNIYIGGNSSTSSYDNVYIKASKSINFTSWGSSYDGLTIDISGKAIRPNKMNYYSLGTSTYSFENIYSYNATFGDTYPLIIESRQLRPRSSSSSNPWYVGTTSYPFDYGYFTCLYGRSTCQLGKDAYAKIGFFGTTPVSRKTVSNSASVSTLISALKGYGLIY